MNTASEAQKQNTPVPNGETKRSRRSSEERHSELLSKEQERLDKNRERALRLAQEAAEAEKEAKEAEARLAKLAKQKPVKPQTKHEVAGAEAAVQAFAKEYADFLQRMKDKFGFYIEAQPPRMTKRGFISSKFKAELNPTLIPLGVRSQTVAAREAGRFINQYKDVGLEPSMINKEVSLQGYEEKYVVAGLRGKGNAIVLVKSGTSESFMMSPDDFKRSLAA